MRNDNFAGSFFFIISTACCYASLFGIFLEREGFDVSVYPACIIVYLPVIFILNYLLLKKERSISFLGIFNGIFTAGLAAVSFVFCGADGFVGICVRIFACIAITYYAVSLVVKSPSLSAYFVVLDISVFLVILAYAVDYFGTYVKSTPEIAIFGAAFALIGLINTRMGNVFGFRGFCIAASALAGLGALAWLFAKHVAGFAGGIITGAFNGLLKAAGFVLKLVERALLWFFSLFPVPDEEFDPDGGMEIINIAGAAEEEAESSGAALIVLIVGLILLAAVFFFVFRKLKIGGVKLSSAAANNKKGISFFDALKRAFKNLSEKIAVIWLLAVKRKTVTGVYFRLERFYSKSALKRRIGETPREFLTRLKAVNSADPEYSSAFDELIEKTELAFYSTKGISEKFGSEKSLYKLTAKQKACILKGAEQ